jgi:hypothetical protein
VNVNEAIEILTEIQQNGQGDFMLKMWNHLYEDFSEISVGGAILKSENITEPINREKINNENCFVVLYEV